MAKKETADQSLTLNEEYQVAAQELRALQSEQQTISHRTAEAGQMGLADTVLNLRQRSDELPMRLLGAEAKVLRLRIRCLQAETPEALEEERALSEAAAEAQAAADEARLLAESTKRRYFAQHEERRSLEINIGDIQRELDNVVARLAQPPAPVVRSRPHAA